MTERNPRGLRLKKLPTKPWQISWSSRHQATRWEVIYKPLGWKEEHNLGVIESTRQGAKGHNRHAWWARSPGAVSDDEPKLNDPGVFVCQNRTKAVQALIDAWLRSRKLQHQS